MVQPTGPHEDAYRQAHAELDLLGHAVTSGAAPAPLLTLSLVEVVRTVLDRHRPEHPAHRYVAPTCRACGVNWELCPEASAVLKALGLPEREDGDV